MTENKILVTGALGQIGSELIMELRKRYGTSNVIASDIKESTKTSIKSGIYEILDVTDREAVFSIIKKYEINTVYHMAAILSATGEKNPALCWKVNMNGSINIMDAALKFKLGTIFIPSSIAAFGPETPRFDTPQETILKPKTMYGVTKVCGELLGDYYAKKLGVDIRGVRYPGIISSETLPGGGTTDYAVDIFYKAVESGKYTCFVKEDTKLPMMYMPDCIKATIDLAEAAKEKLIHCSEYNLAALSFTAGELAEEIRKHIPDFKVSYEPDFRQAIADTWPASIDDSVAREEWGWKPAWNLEDMVKDMIEKLKKRI